jgi:hypothetical protein
VYVLGNPLLYTDPSGHIACLDEECYWVQHPVTGDVIWRGPGAILPVEEYLLDTLRSLVGRDEAERIHRLTSSCNPVDRGAAYIEWTSLVGAGGPYDIKTRVQDRWGNWIWLAESGWWGYETPGNTIYGYAGRAVGFTRLELRGGAGLAQLWEHVVVPTSKGRPPHAYAIGPARSFFDESQDQAGIAIGMDWYEIDRGLVTREGLYQAFPEQSAQLKYCPTSSGFYYNARFRTLGKCPLTVDEGEGQ